jgi:RNA polymerase sigma-70 factor (ECF subfamily)
METDQESGIIKKVIDGDIEAFGFIIRKYQNPLFNLILQMTNSTAASEELLQIVFIKTYEKLSDFKPEFRFFSWIYRIAISETINHLKAAKRFSSLDDRLINQTQEITDDNENLVSAENLQVLVSQLKEEYQILINLKYYQALSYEEISQITGTDIKTVKSRLYMARGILREMILKSSKND